MTAREPGRADQARRDPALERGLALLGEVVGDRAAEVAERTAVALFTPACVAAQRVSMGLRASAEPGFRLHHLRANNASPRVVRQPACGP